MTDDSLNGKGPADHPVQSTTEIDLDSRSVNEVASSAVQSGVIAGQAFDSRMNQGDGGASYSSEDAMSRENTQELRDGTGKLGAENAAERMEEEAEKLEKQQKNLRKTKRQMRAVQSFLFHAFVICFLIWIMFGVIFGVLRMPNGDMSPRIDYGDLLMYYRLDKSFKPDQVVVLEKNDTTYVGRVIAVGGDSVEISDEGRLMINGNAVVEQKISGPTPRYEGFVEYPVKLQSNEYFILVDVRDGGEDSRYYGVVNKKEIKGSVFSLFRRNHF